MTPESERELTPEEAAQLAAAYRSLAEAGMRGAGALTVIQRAVEGLRS